MFLLLILLIIAVMLPGKEEDSQKIMDDYCRMECQPYRVFKSK